MTTSATDILVRAANPELLDQTIQQIAPAVVVGAPDYVKVDGCYVVRVFGDPGFIKFAIMKQGYGEVVRELEELLFTEGWFPGGDPRDDDFIGGYRPGVEGD